MFASTASATVSLSFDITGSFGTSVYSGPLNGGSFVGSFVASLPVPSGGETINSYDIELFNSSHALLDTLTGPSANVSIQSSDCDQGTTLGACDLFLFGAADGSFLEIGVPLGFTGGSVFPGNGMLAGAFGSFAGYRADSFGADSIVSSGTIDPVPEPASVLLFASVAAAAIMAARSRRVC